MEVVKTFKYTVLNALEKPFMKFGKLRKTRAKLRMLGERRCFCCGHWFKNSEYVYTVVLQFRGDRLLCKECNDKALLDLRKENKHVANSQTAPDSIR